VPSTRTATAPSTTGPPAAASSDQTALPPGAADLIRSANDHLARSQQALRDGDWARYGDEQRQLQEDLRRLGDLVGRAPGQ
jgi:hypothetical protein